MWSHYADFHKGFCIGFDESKMRNSGFFGKGGNVLYTNEFPSINPLDDIHKIENAFIPTYFKALEWEYEKEYRLTKLFYPNKPTVKNRLIVLPKDFVVEVILGISISEENKKMILAECEKRNIVTYQIEKIPFKFKVDKVQIN
jgi:hypothetical protein